MLVELYIKNLAVIDELRLKFGPGLTVLSGDEGVGKSLIVDALCLLLGERSSSSLIRTGTDSALVEGIFWGVPDNGLETVLGEAGLELQGDGSLILTRELQAQGRTVARVNSRAVPVSLLRQLGQQLMDIHRQMENLSILNHQRQMDLLDGYGGLLERRRYLGTKVRELREKARQLGSITDKNTGHQRELLEYQIAEIEQANIEPNEEDALQQEERILQRTEALREGCYAAYSKTYADDSCVAGLLRQAAGALRVAAGIDPVLGKHLEALESACVEVEETARDLRRYADNLETGSDRLSEVEARLRLLRDLKNKYGGTLEDVVECANRARQELDELQRLGERRQQLERSQRELEEEAGRLAQKLSADRQQVACGLTERVNSELAELGMPWAGFEIRVKREEDPNGLAAFESRYSYSHDGIDKVEFLGTTNPGEPLMPLADIASGGETCRFMLALKTALQQVDRVPTVVFDEIDSGIGGRGAQVIGRKLVALAHDRQVIAITHLPQIACFGHCHYQVTKEISSGRAFTRVEHLEGESRLEELAAMLGSRDNRAMQETAQELISRAEDSNKVSVSPSA